MHPLLALMALRPQLLLDHAQAYGALFREELAQASVIWRRQALLQAAALGLVSVAVALAGVALLLWAVTPAGQIHAFWLLIATPLVVLSIGLVCAQLSRQPGQTQAFTNLGRQLSADLAMLRAADTP